MMAYMVRRRIAGSVMNLMGLQSQGRSYIYGLLDWANHIHTTGLRVLGFKGLGVEATYLRGAQAVIVVK